MAINTIFTIQWAPENCGKVRRHQINTEMHLMLLQKSFTSNLLNHLLCEMSLYILNN